MKMIPFGNNKEMRYLMNKQEQLKENVIKCCIEGKMTVKQAANRLGLSEGHIKKLKARYRKFGPSSMLHGNCGRQPKHTLDIQLKQKILEIRNLPEYDTVNVSHFKDLLEELYSIKISYSALYRLLQNNNIKSPRKHRKSKQHHRRNRRSTMGELIQVDATPHPFFQGDNKSYTLHGFMDDATGNITGLYMCKNECMQGYFEVTRQMFKNFGIPENIYADGSSIFFTTSKNKLTSEEELSGVERPNTQYGKIMEQVGCHLIKAGSSQAKGRIERLWNTLHDRLITEFKIHHITNMEEANKFLIDYVKKYNKRFGVRAKSKKNSFIPLLKSVNLDTLLTVKYSRQVDNGACFSYKNILFKIQNIQILPRTKVELLISKRIGMKVRYKDKLYSIIPILDKNNIAIDNTESVSNIINEFIYFNCLKNERIA